jgi:ABC-2 type transport system ATP-binding protein
VLADCAAAGCEIEDLEVGRADLEDVFLQIMSDRPVRRPELVSA